MKLLADQNIPHIPELFGPFVEVKQVDASELQPNNLEDADILLVRSVTAVDKSLLSGSKVKLVGTATIGVDHLNRQDLSSMGVASFSAPGCNADAVVDWVFAMLLLWSAQSKQNLQGKTIGIIGAGNVGGRLAEKAQILGLTPLFCDPPRKEWESFFSGISLDELLCQSDIVAVHPSYTTGGMHPTHHLLNARTLGLLQKDVVLLNASRGEVIEEKALAKMAHRLGGVMLDVFEKENRPAERILNSCLIATPHIAGYSQKGKWKASRMLFEQIAVHYQWEVGKVDLSPPQTPEKRIPYRGSLAAFVEDAFGFEALSEQLKKAVEEDPRNFRKIRQKYEFRPEFSELEVTGEIPASDRAILRALQVKVIEEE